MQAIWITMLTIVQPSSSRTLSRRGRTMPCTKMVPPSQSAFAKADRPMSADSVGPGTPASRSMSPMCRWCSRWYLQKEIAPGTTSGTFARIATKRFAVRDRNTRLWQQSWMSAHSAWSIVAPEMYATGSQIFQLSGPSQKARPTLMDTSVRVQTALIGVGPASARSSG